MGSSTLNVIIPFIIKIIEKPQAVLLPDLIFKLQQKLLKFYGLELPKTDLVANILNLENRSFENVSLSPQY